MRRPKGTGEGAIPGRSARSRYAACSFHTSHQSYSEVFGVKFHKPRERQQAGPTLEVDYE